MSVTHNDDQNTPALASTHSDEAPAHSASTEASTPDQPQESTAQAASSAHHAHVHTAACAGGHALDEHNEEGEYLDQGEGESDDEGFDVGLDVLQERIIESLRQVFDPEIPINIYDLGLIYKLDIDTTGRVEVEMTLTTPNCPVAESMPEQVQAAVLATEGVTVVRVNLVWEPPWSPDMMDEDIRLAMGMF
jgi:FeS assembly SUF system protein